MVSLQVDPVEKKPLYHFYPSEPVLSVGTTGCNFNCHFCQNYEISQAYPTELVGREISPEEIVKASFSRGIEMVAATYNEPTVFFELALRLAKEVKSAGGKNIWITNGYIEREPLSELLPYLDAANVDIKFPDERNYRKNTSGSLEKVVETVELMVEGGVWVEITTLVIPSLNDSVESWKPLWERLLNISENLVYHFSAYFPAYRCRLPPTPLSTLKKFEEEAKRSGFKFVYLGNVPSERSTFCPNCGRVLISRAPFYEVSVYLAAGGKCPDCGTPLPGHFR